MPANRKGINCWEVIRGMIIPELDRFSLRYPRSRRRLILERMHQAAVKENTEELLAAGQDYFKLTSTVPPGCYAECPSRKTCIYLSGMKVKDRKRSEVWSIHPYHPQVWR